MPHDRIAPLDLVTTTMTSSLRLGSLFAGLGLFALSGCDRAPDGSTAITVATAHAGSPAETDTAPPALAVSASTDASTGQDHASTPAAQVTATIQTIPFSTEADGASPAGDPPPGSVTPAVSPPPAAAHTMDETNTISVFEAAAPATVFVTQTQVVQDYGMRTVEVPAGAGTGFIWDHQGHIVTNCHVALADCTKRRPARKLSVTLYDQKVYDATLVGADPFKDIAVIKIDPSAPLVPIRRVPDAYDLVVGQKTIAIGNPFGLDHTLTTGVVSAMGREVAGIGGVSIRDMVQTDAAINPGNSGGPLLDSRGQLIGMNTMIYSKSGSSAGIGFAVPHTVIERVVPQLIANGRPTRIGLNIKILDDAFARRLGVQGVIVEQVNPSSPAARDGLRSARRTPKGVAVDVIIGVDGQRVKRYNDLYALVDDKAPGDKVILSVLRLPLNKVIEIPTELVELE